MNESILNSIKKALGLSDEMTQFDQDIILHINSILSSLVQMGIGLENGYRIDDDTSTWEDFLGTDSKLYESVKSYVYIKIRILFDPPSNASHLNSLKEEAKEFEWRLHFQAEYDKNSN